MMNAVPPPGESEIALHKDGMLPANVDAPRFTATETQQARHANWTVNSALVADLMGPLDVSDEETSLLFWDILREFLSAVVSGWVR